MINVYTRLGVLYTATMSLRALVWEKHIQLIKSMAAKFPLEQLPPSTALAAQLTRLKFSPYPIAPISLQQIP